MARILPDVSAAAGPWAQPRQRFFPKVESSSDKALKIMQAISGGVRTASDLYGLGMDIYDRTKETPEEALVRRQEELGDPATRQNIARNQLGGGMVGDEYDPMLGKGPADLSGFRQAQEERVQEGRLIGPGWRAFHRNASARRRRSVSVRSSRTRDRGQGDCRPC